jgi:hypothetical protein
MKRLLLITTALFFSVSFCEAQFYTPLELTKKLLSKDPFPNLKNYCTGEFNGRPNGADLAPNVRLSFRILKETNKDAMINVSAIKDFEQFDSYLFFEKDTIWKVSAFRALAMTGIIAKVNQDLKALSKQQVDSIVAAPHTSKEDNRMFKSKEEYLFTLGNTNLTLASDSALIANFVNNKEKFENVRVALISKNIMSADQDTRQMKGIDVIQKQLRLLFINNVYPNNDGTKNTLTFLIGGILDNAVGYIYIPNKADVPEITPSHYILIREIVQGWYLYKTT